MLVTVLVTVSKPRHFQAIFKQSKSFKNMIKQRVSACTKGFFQKRQKIIENKKHPFGIRKKGVTHFFLPAEEKTFPNRQVFRLDLITSCAPSRFSPVAFTWFSTNSGQISRPAQALRHTAAVGCSGIRFPYYPVPRHQFGSITDINIPQDAP